MHYSVYSAFRSCLYSFLCNPFNNFHLLVHVRIFIYEQEFTGTCWCFSLVYTSISFISVHVSFILTDDFANSGEMLEPPSSPDQLSDPTDLSPEAEEVSPTFPGTVQLDTQRGLSGSSESK